VHLSIFLLFTSQSPSERGGLPDRFRRFRRFRLNPLLNGVVFRTKAPKPEQKGKKGLNPLLNGVVFRTLI